MPVDVSNEAQVKSVEALKASRDRQWDDVIRAVLDQSPETRQFVWTLVDACGLYKGHGYTPDTGLLQFEDGKRQFGLWLLGECRRAAPLSFRKLEEETAARLARERFEDQNASRQRESAE